MVRAAVLTSIIAMPLLALSLAGCSSWLGVSRRPAPPSGFGMEGREDPALSGDGRLLASLVERNGRSSVLLQERLSGKVLPLRTLNGQQPHSSPSLSWNGRYLALIVQRGERRLAMIEDRATGRPHPLLLPGGQEPQRLSLAPDGRRLAVQLTRDGVRRVELFDLGGQLEADLAPGLPIQPR
ncbi:MULTISPECIES: TolB family protein [Synechococcales]|uniref:TolB family protein n=1 Tax=Synechococcus sp. CS-1324 TaxID=2847980 RepID=UPI0037D9E468